MLRASYVRRSGFSFIFRNGAAASEERTSTSDALQTSTAVVDALQRLGQLDRHLGEVRDNSDAVANATAGVTNSLYLDLTVHTEPNVAPQVGFDVADWSRSRDSEPKAKAPQTRTSEGHYNAIDSETSLRVKADAVPLEALPEVAEL
ncbi:unnamed protein product [Phytophthora fragariaefolia]|uniref:Unnamed protein product n=1 Tax=Phytophthora fragariaefolia TaxID=1490495 RepID=A0A9W6Y1G7_9STRA|nr:unnamed protein product [Phytophthora fragariaefolia]